MDREAQAGLGRGLESLMHNLGPRMPACLALVVLLVAIAAGPVRVAAAQAMDGEGAERLRAAAAIQAATRARLRVLGDAMTCAEARFVSYRHSDHRPELVEQWYVASQLFADAALLLAGTSPSGRPPVAQLPPRGRPATSGSDEAEARCHLEKGFIFLDRLWDYEAGGYFPHSNPTGTQPSREARYADDNALSGLAFLAAAETTPDPSLRGRYLHAARREADFLVESGVWDETFGGGFWWNTDKGTTPEGKPAQTNAVAALFFARLHRVTQDELHRAWALRTLLWLDTVLYDRTRRLYRWGVSYDDPAERAGPPVIPDRYFSYDQGIALEAQLLAADLDGDLNRVLRAREIGRALHAAFWSPDRSGYNLEAGVDQVYTSYAAWASLGHLALYDHDGDPGWLDMARANADGLTAALREPDGGYALRHYRCVDQAAPGCEGGAIGRVVDRARNTAAQAWIQHLQAGIARRLVARPASSRVAMPAA